MSFSAAFSSEAWERAQPWYATILEHPFVRELGDGTLPAEVFVRYIVDDTHYLARYARALAATSARWPEPAGAALIATFAAGSLQAEQVTHETLLAQFGVDLRGGLADGTLPEPTPTCLTYVNTLLADAAYAPVGVAMAGVLPCFRIYAEVGRQLVTRLSEIDGHPYESWLRMYGDEAFSELTREAERLTDEQAEREPGSVPGMHQAYARAARFEWMFWDAAWRGERWPSASAASMVERATV